MKLFSLFAELSLDSSKFDTGVKNASSAGRGLASTLKSGIGGAATFVGNKVSATTIMLGNLMADTVKQGAGVVKQLAKTGLDYNAQMETYATNFRTMLGGSAEAAEKLTGDLQEMAASTPFAMTDLADATQTLLAFGQDSESVLDTLQSLGDISMGDANKLQSLTLAFAQASSSGKLMGQDLLQMINAGFNPLQTIVDKTGASMGDLKKFMSDGKASDTLKKQMKIAQREVKEYGDQASVGAKILAKMAQEGVISAETLGMIFEAETSPGGKFYGAMEAASKTMTGLFSTLQDDSSALMGKVFTPITNWMKEDLLPDTISLVGEISEAFDEGGLPAAVKTATDKVKGYFAELAPVALDAGSNLLANVLSGITGDTFSSEGIKRAITGLWSDGEAALTTFKTNAGGVLKGIWDGITGDSENKTNISQEIAGLWTDGSTKLTEFADAAGGLLGTIYETITGQEATATNIGNTIGGLFNSGITAIGNVLTSSTTFFNDVDNALGDPDASIGKKIEGVFAAGTNAMINLLNDAGTFMSDLYAAITGDKEGAAKIQFWVDSLFENSEERAARIAAESKRRFEAKGEEIYSVPREERAIPLMDMLSTLYASGEWAGGISESVFDEWAPIVRRGGTSQTYQDVEAEIVRKYEAFMDGTWNKEPSKEEDEDNEALSSAIENLSNKIDSMNKEDPTINVNVSVNGNMASLVTAVSSALARGARAAVIGP